MPTSLDLRVQSHDVYGASSRQLALHWMPSFPTAQCVFSGPCSSIVDSHTALRGIAKLSCFCMCSNLSALLQLFLMSNMHCSSL